MFMIKNVGAKTAFCGSSFRCRSRRVASLRRFRSRSGRSHSACPPSISSPARWQAGASDAPPKLAVRTDRARSGPN